MPKKIVPLNLSDEELPKFVTLIATSQGPMALDENGGIWVRYFTQDGTKDQFGNPHAVWIQMEDERAYLTETKIIEPS